jgi:hypothetical protein
VINWGKRIELWKSKVLRLRNEEIFKNGSSDLIQLKSANKAGYA